MDKSREMASDDYLLYDEANHISSQILQGEEIEPVWFISVDPKSQLWKLNLKMKEYVRRTGLQHLAELKKGKIDHALINELIISFHFVGGEVTITLEDISYLYGLPIDGKAVTGPVWSTRAKLGEAVLKMLGVKVDAATYLKGGQLSLPWIQKKIQQATRESYCC
ncbi:hypothetical protein AAC387_Pa11g1110 [Persea americana]